MLIVVGLEMQCTRVHDCWLTRQPPPRGTATGELDDSRREHEAEQQPLDEPEHDVVVRVVRSPARDPQPVERRQQDAEEPSLQKQDVPEHKPKLPYKIYAILYAYLLPYH